MQKLKESQILPILLTIVVFIGLCIVLLVQVQLINLLVPGNKIALQIRPQDVIIGLTIYLKTAIDFAIFIGRLIEKNNTLKSRIAIEVGTALGNALGTMLIVLVWVILKEVPALLAVMILIASLVLLELGEAGLEHMESLQNNKRLRWIYLLLHNFFRITGIIYKPILSKIMPNISERMRGVAHKSTKALFIFSITIPFILGLDDFAGYVSLFNIINIFGFAIGVFAGHMFLNICLFASPQLTIKVVRNRWVALVGTVAFIVLALIGFVEVFGIVLELIRR